MRNKNFDADLLKTLNEQPMPAAPLTDDEFARVLDAACASCRRQKRPPSAVFRGAGGRSSRSLRGRGAGQRQLCRPPPWPSSCLWWAACSAG